MKTAILIASKRLSAMKFFPSDTIAQNEIMRALGRMVSTPQELEWLVDTLIDLVDEWPGLREVRGLLCTRFKPRDGKETTCKQLPGFSGEDCEGRAALEPARLLAGTAEAPMSAAEHKKFLNELLTPLLNRRPRSHVDSETLRRAESEIARCKPTRSEAEKRRMIEEIEASPEFQKLLSRVG
jgi:hypothetical protein